MAQAVVSERGALAGFRQRRRDTVKNPFWEADLVVRAFRGSALDGSGPSRVRCE